MKRKWTALSFIALFVTVVLEILPYGAVLYFAPGPGETTRETYSYFSLIPYGYANFGPLVTAVLTAAVSVLSAIMLVAKGLAPKLSTVTFICTIIAVIASFTPLMYGLNYLSAAGLSISALLILSAVFQRIARKD